MRKRVRKGERERQREREGVRVGEREDSKGTYRHTGTEKKEHYHCRIGCG